MVDAKYRQQQNAYDALNTRQMRQYPVLSPNNEEESCTLCTKPLTAAPSGIIVREARPDRRRWTLGELGHHQRVYQQARSPTCGCGLGASSSSRASIP